MRLLPRRAWLNWTDGWCTACYTIAMLGRLSFASARARGFPFAFALRCIRIIAFTYCIPPAHAPMLPQESLKVSLIKLAFPLLWEKMLNSKACLLTFTRGLKLIKEYCMLDIS